MCGFENEFGHRRRHCGCEGEKRHEGRHRHMTEEEYLALDTDKRLGITFHRLNHMSRAIFGDRHGQRRILFILSQEGDMTQRELTERLGIRPGSASEIIGKLERAGWISRSESEEDRRTADVHLTEAGREQLADHEQNRPELFSALNSEEKEQLLSLLEKLGADWRERFPMERRRECHHMHKGRCGHGEDRAE